MRSPGIEPGTYPWKGYILPLNHKRLRSEGFEPPTSRSLAVYSTTELGTRLPPEGLEPSTTRLLCKLIHKSLALYRLSYGSGFLTLSTKNHNTYTFFGFLYFHEYFLNLEKRAILERRLFISINLFVCKTKNIRMISQEDSNLCLSH